jgi:uncharacterized protein
VLIDTADPAAATCVLAHGAGAGHDSPVMAALAHGLVREGLTVVRFDFPYMERRRSTGKRMPPNPFPQLAEAFERAVSRLAVKGPLIVAGKSLGARVAAACAARVGARGVVAFGYPFHPPRSPDKLRVELLSSLQVPCLVFQGTRDRFGTPAEVQGYALGPHVRVHWLAEADHDLTPPKRTGGSREACIAEACAAAGTFARALA